MRLWNSAAALLIVTGAFLGLSLPLGKIATEAGIAAPVWAFVISFGAGGLLLPAMLARGERFTFTIHKLRYFIITALVSYALPNLLLFIAIPHLGSGYTGIMFTLSPVITLGLSILARIRRPNRLGILGIAVGFAGALIVALTRGEAGQPAAFIWVIVALGIPVFLATGNIYRTLDWPPNTSPLELAVGSHLASAALLLTGMFVFMGGFPANPLAIVPLATLAQALAAATMFVFFFRLQAVGGPVYLSQIGYVAAAVGLVIGTLLLGEIYSLATWAGAIIIGIGVLLTTKAQRQSEALAAQSASSATAD